VDPLHRWGERIRAEHVADHDLRKVAPRASLQARRVAYQATDAVALLYESWNQPAADIPCRARDEDEAAADA
jgi:hypothetical protein